MKDTLHPIVLYITLAIATVALVLGIVGMLKTESPAPLPDTRIPGSMEGGPSGNNAPQRSGQAIPDGTPQNGSFNSDLQTN